MVTDLGSTVAHGHKVIITLYNPHSQRPSYDMSTKVVLYGRIGTRFLETYRPEQVYTYPALLITGRLAVEKDGSLFVIAHVYHEMEVAE